MSNKRYLEIFGLPPDTSLDDLNQAYRDLVNIWHPDRFSHNPRLRKKAEEKLKELNRAYEALKPLLSSEPGIKKDARKESYERERGTSGDKQGTGEQGNPERAEDNTEAIVEAGTTAVLKMWSYLSARFRNLVTEQVQAFKEGSQGNPQGRGTGRGRGRGKGRGGGKGRRQFRGGGGKAGGAKGR